MTRLDRYDVQSLAEELLAEYHHDNRFATGDRYPVMVAVTNTHIVWVEADSAEGAVRSLKDDGEWYEHLDGNPPVEGDYEVSAPEASELTYLIYADRLGPLNACRSCGRTQYSPGSAWISHTDDCPTRGGAE